MDSDKKAFFIQEDGKYERLANRLQLFEDFYRILDQWLYLKEQGKSVIAYFNENNYSKIAIYGMGSMALHLISELSHCESVSVVCGIDKKADRYYTDVPVYTLEDCLPEFDCIVVTVRSDLNRIREYLLREKRAGQAVALEEIVFWEV